MRCWFPFLSVVCLALAWAATAQAANPVSPADGATVTDTHTPTFTVHLDPTVQADGEVAEHDPGIAVTGSDGHGGTTTVAFCKGVDQGGGMWSCSDPQHPLPNGVYVWSFNYMLHSCLVLPASGGYQPPPSCLWNVMPGVGGVFRIAVQAAPPGNTDLVSPHDGAAISPPPTLTVKAPAQATMHIYVSLNSARLSDGSPAGLTVYKCSGQTSDAGRYDCRDDTGSYYPGETYYWWAVVDVGGGSWVYGPRSFTIKDTSGSGGGTGSGGGVTGSSGGSVGGGAGRSRARTVRDAPYLPRAARWTGKSVKETRLSSAVYALTKVLGAPKLVDVACWSSADWKSASGDSGDGFYSTLGFYTPLMPHWVELSPSVCRAIETLLHHRPAYPNKITANAVETLTHETMHAIGVTKARYGSHAEAAAECYAMQLSIVLAIKLGVPSRYANNLARFNLINYQTRPPGYRDPVRCRENGVWDLFKNRDSPPWHTYQP